MPIARAVAYRRAMPTPRRLFGSFVAALIAAPVHGLPARASGPDRIAQAPAASGDPDTRRSLRRLEELERTQGWDDRLDQAREFAGAYAAGRSRGRGLPLVIYGAVQTFVGGILLAVASSSDDDTVRVPFTISGIFVTGLGLAQLVPGTVMMSRGYAARPDPSEVDLFEAWEAGNDVGVGTGLLGYSVLWGLSLASALTSASEGGASADDLLGPGVLFGVHVGLGAWRYSRGHSRWDALRAPLGAAPGTVLVPLLSIDF